MVLSIISIVFGILSFAMSCTIFSSQTFAFFKTRNTSGTSIWTYVILLVCASLCFSWATLFYFSRMSDWFAEMDTTPLWINQWAVIPLILLYLFDIIAGIWIIYTKNKHIKLSKKLHITELELATYLLKLQRQRFVKSGNKIYYRKYFSMFILITFIVIILAAAGTCMTIFTDPTFVPSIIYKSPDEKAMQPYIITLSILGAITWEAMSWPQFAKCVKTKDTSGISLLWSIFLPLSCLISFIYAFTLAFNSGYFKVNTIGALVFNGIIVNVGILILKVKNRIKSKQLHMSEIEYTKKHLQKKKKRA